MGISTLQQLAFINSQEFLNQVDSTVKEQALLKATADGDGGNSALLAQVIRNPRSYGFAPTIVADNNWFLTYDPWAADTEAGEIPILAGVQAWFNLLTGFIPPPPP